MSEPATVCDAAPISQGQRCPMGATLRERVLDLARSQLGVREDDGPNRDKAGRIALYLTGCMRNGKRLYIGPSPWCAAFVSWCAWQASGVAEAAIGWEPAYDVEGAPPIGYRASVAEHCADALASGALYVAGAGNVPQAGDVAILGRADAGYSVRNPLHGGEGHEAFYVGEDEHGSLLLLGGNQDDAVTIKAYPPSAILAWIALEP